MPINVNSRYRGNSDINMRHSDTMVGVVQPNGSVTPYIVVGTSSMSRGVGLELRKAYHIHRGDDSLLLGINDNTLLLDRPDCGFANLQSRGKTIAVFYATRALRQYKRSLVMGQLHTTAVGSPPQGLTGSSRDNRGLAAYCFFNDSYPMYSSALAKITAGDAFSVAISDKFALCLHRVKGIVLYYKDELVGYVDAEDNLHLVPAKIHLQEQLNEVL